jgi:UDP-2,3-diacylglucosamine hydrolase
VSYSWAVIAVFADAHVGRSPDDDAPFRQALDRVARRGPREIHLLGDIFHYLIGDRKFSTPGIERVLRQFEAIRRSGTLLRYVEGNRDFFLQNSYLERYFDEISRETRFVAGERRYLLVHGDGVNERDWPYRFWRLASKNPISFGAMKLVPRPLARQIVSRVEARLNRSNFKHKQRLPLDMLRRYGARRLAEGYDVLLFGHFHAAWREQVDGGLVEILPAFCEERRWLEVEETGEGRLVGPP